MVFYAICVPLLLALLGFAFLWLTVTRRRALRLAHEPLWRNAVEIGGLSLFTLALLVLAGTSAWNSVATFVYRATHVPPGTIHVVDGVRMRIDCTGEGSPTVILDAGMGYDGLIWGKVQPALSKLTRVCSYDRAGFGWSDSRTGTRDADHIADELHGLLQQADVRGPVVLMAHSIAALYIRDFAARHPQGVVGLVFVDGSTPLQQDHGSAALRALARTSTLDIFGTKAVFALGLARIEGLCEENIPGFDAATNRALANNFCVPWEGASIANELANMRRSGEETVHTGPFGDLPVLIFSHDPDMPRSSRLAPTLGREHERGWDEMQEGLKTLSSRSRRIVAKASGHYIHLERADLVSREVVRLIQDIRRGVPPSDNGSTKTE